MTSSSSIRVTLLCIAIVFLLTEAYHRPVHTITTASRQLHAAKLSTQQRFPQISTISHQRRSSTGLFASTLHQDQHNAVRGDRHNFFQSILHSKFASGAGKIASLFGIVLSVVLGKGSVASAAVGGVKRKVHGIDLYGRMPHDGWLFSTWTLTDPNLLKRSFVETVVSEIPECLGAFERRKAIMELKAFALGGLGFMSFIATLGFLYKLSMRGYKNYLKKSDNLRGYKMGISGQLKGAPKRGKAMSDLGEGFFDMDKYEDEGDDDDDLDDAGGNKKKDDGDDDDEED